jgi:hypothetical protein
VALAMTRERVSSEVVDQLAQVLGDRFQSSLTKALAVGLVRQDAGAVPVQPRHAPRLPAVAVRRGARRTAARGRRGSARRSVGARRRRRGSRSPPARCRPSRRSARHDVVRRDVELAPRRAGRAHAPPDRFWSTGRAPPRARSPCGRGRSPSSPTRTQTAGTWARPTRTSSGRSPSSPRPRPSRIASATRRGIVFREAQVHRLQGRLESGRAASEAGILLARRAGELEVEALCVAQLGLDAYRRGDYVEAGSRYDVAIDLVSPRGKPRNRGAHPHAKERARAPPSAWSPCAAPPCRWLARRARSGPSSTRV